LGLFRGHIQSTAFDSFLSSKKNASNKRRAPQNSPQESIECILRQGFGQPGFGQQAGCGQQGGQPCAQQGGPGGPGGYNAKGFQGESQGRETK